MIGRKRFHVHLDQADKGTAKIRSLAAAAVHDYADRANNPAVRANDVDRLLDTSAAGDNVLRDDEALLRRDFESAAQNETAFLFFLGKDVTFAERAADFLADDNAAERRRDDRVASEGPQLVG